MPRYQSFPFEGFGKGLNLRDKPDAINPAECIDALNVLFTDRGAIEQRDGFAKLTEKALTNRVGSLEPFYTTAGLKQLLAGCGTRLEAISGGAVLSSVTGLTSAVWDFARFGQPNAEVAYAGNGTDTLRKWSGAAWSAPTATVDEVAAKAMPKAGLICVEPFDNRLVASGFSTAAGGPNGGISSPSHVYWSEPGDPESWISTDYEQFTPGDGERIQAVIAWQEFVFVFKETKFFVVYGSQVDEEGNPEFLYRPVETGVGLVSPRAVCIHPSGVYFMSRRGVYRTTGQAPELVSGLVDPIFLGGSSIFYLGGEIASSSIANCAMTTFQERIYLSFPTESANNRTLVYDPKFGWWSLLDLPCSALVSFRPSSEEELVFGYAAGANHIGRHAPSFTNDDGVAIASHWRSGWFDLGTPDVKKVRASKVWATGGSKVSVGIVPDFRQGVGSLDVLDFADPTVTDWDESTWSGGEWAEPHGLIGQERRKAVRGATFSVYFENLTLNQDWSVHRVEHLVKTVRDPAKVAG